MSDAGPRPPREAEELRRLRERAYGRHPDIDEDAAALERLHQLENNGLEVAPDASGTGARTAGAVEDVTSSPTPAAPRHRRIRLLPVGLMVLVSALVCVGTLIVSKAVEASRSAGDDVAAVLVADDTLPWLTQISNDSVYPPSGTRFEDFHGLSVASIANGDGSDGSRCLYVVPQVTAAAITGACSAGPFPAQSTLLVTADLPAELTDVYVVGTALQFTLDGDQVVVRTATPYGSGTPPISAR